MFGKRFLLFLVLISILVLPVSVSAEILWNQPLSAVNTNAYINQDFYEPEMEDTTTFIADDFPIDGTAWDISTIFVPGNFRYAKPGSSLLNATFLHWKIYRSSAGKPSGYPGGGAAPVWEAYAYPDDPAVTITEGTGGYLSDVAVTLDPPVRLDPGHYWLIFYPELSYNDWGYQGRQPSDTLYGAEAYVIRPSGLPGDFIPNVWTSVLEIPAGSGWSPALTLELNDFAFRLEGTRVGATEPNISVTPETLDFGSEALGTTSAAQVITIANTGTGPLSINEITITGGIAVDFSKADGGTCGNTFPLVLATSESCTQNVTFTPSALGGRVNTLQIVSDDPDTTTAQVALSGTGVEGDVVPSVTEGTVGTVITFTAEPGISFGDKKGKVLIQNADVTSNTKIARDGWSSTSITCTVQKALPAGVYDVKIMLQPYKDDISIDLPGAFTYKKPEVDILAVSNGAKGDRRVITGHFFGNKKPKVYLVYQDKNGVSKKKNCPVTSMINWVAVTGVSSIEFKVPGGLAAGTYPLYVERKGVGISEEVVNFTIIE
jgi:hypothetical protein